MAKKVLVTGSTKGIGKAVAEKFHSQGWNVGITARGQEEISEITNLFNQKRQNSAIGIKADLSSKEETNNLKNHLEREWQEIDCIVFNVGSGSGTKGLTSTSEENELLLRTNFIDVVRSFRVLLPLVKKEMGASLIFIGSIAQEINVNAPVTSTAELESTLTISRICCVSYAVNPRKIMIARALITICITVLPIKMLTILAMMIAISPTNINLPTLSKLCLVK